MPNYDIKSPKLSEKEFQTIASFVESHLGIKMPVTKQVMLQSRLQSRLKALGKETYKEYIDYVFHSQKGADEELVHMIDVVTTNKTEFFRENDHFEYMHSQILPELLKKTNHIKVWSAGCSTGEEPYTLCMVMEKHMERTGQNFNYSILATDISTRVLGKAKDAIYTMNTVEDLPLETKKKYFLKSKDSSKALVRIKPKLRSHVSFKRLNFMDNQFSVPKDFHIIFCRNVIIYFDKPTQEVLINKFCQHLQSNCFLFLGHSETIMNMNLPLKTIAPTIYRRT